MQLTHQLQKKLSKAVHNSMRIEGYRANPSPKLQEKVKALMELQRVKVSVPAK